MHINRPDAKFSALNYLNHASMQIIS